MRIYIILLLAFAFVLPLSAQTLVEKFRSEPNERWLNRAQLSQRTQGSFENYFDPNVDFKGLSYVKNDSLIILWCIRFTNGTDIVDDFIIEGSKPDDNDLWGPVNLDGTGNYELAVWRRSAGSPTGSLSLFSMDASTTELTAQIDGVVGFFVLLALQANGTMHDSYWFFWWRLSLYVQLGLAILGGLWVSVGGIFDLRKMFHRLNTIDRNALDDGRVVGDQNLADAVSEQNPPPIPPDAKSPPK